MDLSAFTTDRASEGAVLELRLPSGAPMLTDDKKPVTITLLGHDADVVTELANEQANRHFRQGLGAKITAEGALANEIELLVKATVSWSGLVFEGEELKCTPDNARRIYRDFPFIRDQARAFMSDRANFYRASPKS